MGEIFSPSVFEHLNSPTHTFLFKFWLTGDLHYKLTGLAEAPANEDLQQRLLSLMEYQTDKIFATICRGLFETHKALFAALICIQILREREEITKSELNLLLRGAGVVDRSVQKPCPDPSRLIETQWDLVNSMETDCWTDGGDGVVDSGDERQPFLGLPDSMIDNWPEWMEWANCTDPLHTKPATSLCQ